MPVPACVEGEELAHPSAGNARTFDVKFGRAN